MDGERLTEQEAPKEPTRFGPGKMSPKAILSVVCGIGSLLGLGLLTAIPGIIVGHMALWETWRTRHERKSIGGDGRGWARIGLSACYISIFLYTGIFLARQDVLSRSCAVNLKVMGVVLNQFAANNSQAFPRISPEPGRLAFALSEGMYPDYLMDLRILECPSVYGFKPSDPLSDQEAAIDDTSYLYLGYAVANDKDVEDFAHAYEKCISEGLTFDRDLLIPSEDGTGSRKTIWRLRKDVFTKFAPSDFNLPSDARREWLDSSVPIVIERPHNHRHHGGNVLYLDGHVEFIEYPGEWPMTKTTISLLESLDAMKSRDYPNAERDAVMPVPATVREGYIKSGKRTVHDFIAGTNEIEQSRKAALNWLRHNMSYNYTLFSLVAGEPLEKTTGWNLICGGLLRYLIVKTTDTTHEE